MIISLSILLIFIFWDAFSGTNFNKEFTIRKGRHYSNKLFFRIFFFLKNRTFKFNLSFDSSWRYNLNNNDQLDVNKLIGFGFLPWHHVYSIRFGARYNIEKDKIEIIPYAYVKKKRIIGEVIAECSLDGMNYVLNLDITKTSYILSIEKNGIKLGESLIVKGHNQKFGYILKPYFGGNQVAPHDIKTKISRIA